MFPLEDISPISANNIANPFADVAFQYGSSLVGTGRKMVDTELNQYLQVPVLKTYFDVDTSYVKKKIGLVLFPVLNKVSIHF